MLHGLLLLKIRVMTSDDEMFSELSVCTDPVLIPGPPEQAPALYPCNFICIHQKQTGDKEW
jgi:hypothetical protein